MNLNIIWSESPEKNITTKAVRSLYFTVLSTGTVLKGTDSFSRTVPVQNTAYRRLGMVVIFFTPLIISHSRFIVQTPFCNFWLFS